jgi:hypothetical protein
MGHAKTSDAKPPNPLSLLCHATNPVATRVIKRILCRVGSPDLRQNSTLAPIVLTETEALVELDQASKK